nr:hypothetical protein [uncultured Albidiferax sp.]
MAYYDPAKEPSERTIETNANHWLLSLLLNPHAWIFAPTTPEEFALGFDAELIGTYKYLFIQYKGIKKSAGNGVRFNIDPAQRTMLQLWAPKQAYYAFSEHRTHDGLRADFAAYPVKFFEHCRFILEDHLHPATSSVRGSAIIGFRMYSAAGVNLGLIPPARVLTGPVIAQRIRSCKIGGKLTKGFVSKAILEARWWEALIKLSRHSRLPSIAFYRYK